MGITMLYVVGGCQILESEGGRPVVSKRPVETRGSQCSSRSGQIDEVPGATTILVGVFIRIEKVPPEPESGDGVIESRRVPTKGDGSGLIEPSMDISEERCFGMASGRGHLRCNARDEAGFRSREPISRWLAPACRRFVLDWIQSLVGPNGGELTRSADGWFGAIGFEIVEEE